MPTDIDLLAAWRAGDRAAGAELFDRHFDEIHRFFRNKVAGDAEDLIQRTFLACVESRDRFRGDASFRTYLFTVAHHVLHHHWRDRRPPGEAVDFSAVSFKDLSPTPSGVVAERQEQRVLLEALRSIPFDFQVALELHYWEDLSGPELGAVLGIPEGTVRSRLRRAKEALARRLSDLAGAGRPLATTLDDIDGWARSLKREIGRRPAPPDGK